MADHRKRFERWRGQLPEKGAYLVEQVLARAVPALEERGFVWYPDFAGGDASQLGANVIPLQRRSGEEWPTVQIAFDERGRPAFSVDFAALPRVCKRNGAHGKEDVARERALVFEGPAYFSLCKDRGSVGQFGYHTLLLAPRRRIDAEVDRLLALLPELLELLDRGIPREWLRGPFGHVTDHVVRMDSQLDAFETGAGAGHA